jgi:hypothetical protein
MERTPQAFIAALKMDPNRKNVFVEGNKDRLFLKWLTEGKKNPNCQIVEISFVKFNTRLEGNKEKIKYFAKIVGSENKNIKFFCDSDYDTILSQKLPPNIITTDNNDIEAYLFEKSFIEKSLVLGYGCEKINSEIIINTCLNIAAKIGVLRILSFKNNYHFSINDTNIIKYIHKSGEVINFDFEGFLRAVIQNSKLSLKEFTKYQKEHISLLSAYSDLPLIKLTRGKDLIVILSKTIKEFG